MANRIKGLVVTIDGETTGLDKALKSVNTTIRETQTKLKDVEKLLKLDPSNTELLSQKQQTLKEKISATKEKLGRAEDCPGTDKTAAGVRRSRKGQIRYLQSHPLCVQCQKKGRYTKATVVDHIAPQRGDRKLFWDPTNWQALCKPCHDRKTFTEDIRPAYEYRF